MNRYDACCKEMDRLETMGYAPVLVVQLEGKYFELGLDPIGELEDLEQCLNRRDIKSLILDIDTVFSEGIDHGPAVDRRTVTTRLRTAWKT